MVGAGGKIEVAEPSTSFCPNLETYPARCVHVLVRPRRLAPCLTPSQRPVFVKPAGAQLSHQSSNSNHHGLALRGLMALP
jgi:hypothetical protein